MDTKTMMDTANTYNMPTYGRFAVALERGKGVVAQDPEGKSYIDFGSGIGVNSLGYCDDKWAAAVANQAATLQHTSNLYYSGPQTALAEKLCTATGYARVFFGNSGAESNECAIKLARKYSFDKYGPNRNKIITLVNSFHGRTMATLTATGQDVFHNYFFPFPEGFDYAVANDIEDLKAKLDDSVCAVMFEFIQGEGGVVPLDKDFVQAMFALCQERDILTISDEVQTGMGRTGTLLAGELFGVKADIVTLAKGLGGGLPIGACMAKEAYACVLGPGAHGSTFGGNPVACAGANVVMDRLTDPMFLAEAAGKGGYLKAKLEQLPNLQGVTGLGLMLGAFPTKKPASQVVKEAMEGGLLLLTAKDKLRFLPPLVITRKEIDQGVEILRKVLE